MFYDLEKWLEQYPEASLCDGLCCGHRTGFSRACRITGSWDNILLQRKLLKH